MDLSLRETFLAHFAALDGRDARAADAFFSNGQFFPGTTIPADRPYERFRAYENLLDLLRRTDPDKFARLHKGTPYYFLAWTAFDFRDYERAVFYMDAAISEDVRVDPGGWHSRPASHFIFLRKDHVSQSAQPITAAAHAVLDRTLAEFNGSFGAQLTVENLVDRFVKTILLDPAHRSVVTSLYSFVLEFDDRATQLALRSMGGGTLEPFLLHLLKGCLVFESLLKGIYTGLAAADLGSILKDPFITRDLRYKSILIDTSAGVRKTLQDIVRHLWPALQAEAPHDRAITIAYAVRNTTAHSLLWPDVFAQHYVDLFRSILFAIYYVICTKY